MKFTRLAPLFSGVFIASLLITPSLAEIKVFGYAGAKTGYTLHQSVDPLVLKSNRDINSGPADSGVNVSSFSPSSIPFGADVGLGYYFTPSLGFRVEAEYFYRLGLDKKISVVERKTPNVPLDSDAKVSFSTQTALSNFYLDYYVDPSINLFLSAGAGVSLLGTKFHVVAKGGGSPAIADKTHYSITFAWQVGLGMGYAINRSLGLDFNVRYVGIGKPELRLDLPPFAQDARAKVPNSTMEALFGFNYRF